MKYSSSLYALTIEDSEKQEGEIDRKEAVITVNNLVRFHFDYNTLIQITNTVISLIYPNIGAKNEDTETILTASMVNTSNEHSVLDHTNVVRGTIMIKRCDYSRYEGSGKEHFSYLHLLVAFHVEDKYIGSIRMQIVPS